MERKSNISRLFGKFTSPSEKLLMNVPGPHNHTVGQESNILTEMGIRRFLDTNKMKGQDHYRQWIVAQLIPRLRNGDAPGQAGEVQQAPAQPRTPQRDAAVKRELHQQQPHPGLSAPHAHHLSVYGASDSPQSLPSSPQSYSSSYSSDSYAH